MGPIHIKLGVEQGGRLADKYFWLCGNDQLTAVQTAGLGLHIKFPSTPATPSIHITAIGQADDTCLLSTDPHALTALVYPTKDYCKKFHSELVPEKLNCYALTLINKNNLQPTQMQY